MTGEQVSHLSASSPETTGGGARKNASFIPFRKTSIVTMCADEVAADERESFRAFTELLASLLHHEFRGRLETLKDSYHPFNPDADTRTIVELDADERHAAQHRLVAELTALAEAANFERISTEDLDRAFVEESLMKVRLGTDVEKLPFTPASTIIKLFQDVPRADLEMLFPNARVKMRRIDKLLIGVPAVISGIIMIVTKLLAALLPVLLLLGFWVGVHDEPVELNQAQLVALLVRQFTKFKNRKIQFMKALTAVSLDEAKRRLDRTWDNLFTYHAQPADA